MRRMALPLVGALAAVAAALAALVGRKRPSCPERYRARVVSIAAAELGTSEADNPDRITEYIVDAVGNDPRGRGGRLEWCGIFALWALHQAGLGRGVRWPIGATFLGKLPSTSDPQPGDIAYFTHNQHHAIVERVNDDRTVDLINGNGTGAKVTRSTNVPLEKARSYESIQPWIDEVC